MVAVVQEIERPGAVLQKAKGPGVVVLLKAKGSGVVLWTAMGPGKTLQKAMGPGVVPQKIERPGVVLQKIERPGVVPQRVKGPDVALWEYEKQGEYQLLHCPLYLQMLWNLPWASQQDALLSCLLVSRSGNWFLTESLWEGALHHPGCHQRNRSSSSET